MITTNKKQLANNAFQFYGFGIVAKDKGRNTDFLEIFSPDNNYEHSGSMWDTRDIVEVPVTNELAEPDKKTIQVTQTSEAKWLALGNANRLSPPDVVKGETIALYKIGDGKTIFWDTFRKEGDLRRNEHYGLVCSNTPSDKETLTDTNTYWSNIDCQDKFVKLMHVSDNDGELTTWDISIDTKEGLFSIIDGKSNYLKIDAKVDDYSLFMLHDANTHAVNDIYDRADRDHIEEIARHNRTTAGVDITMKSGRDTKTRAGQHIIEIADVDNITEAKNNIMNQANVDILSHADRDIFDHSGKSIINNACVNLERFAQINIVEECLINRDEKVGVNYTIVCGGVIDITAPVINLHGIVNITGALNINGVTTATPPISNAFTVAKT